MTHGLSFPPSKNAVATPYLGEDGIIRWEWNICPDCGKIGAHHSVTINDEPRQGVRCG